MSTALSVSLRHVRSFLILSLITALCTATPGAFAKDKGKRAEGEGDAPKAKAENADKGTRAERDAKREAKAENADKGTRAERDAKREAKAEGRDMVVIADEAALLTVLNQADTKTLQLLPGVGKTTATAILAARPIAALDDLLKVDGIAEKRLEKIKSSIGKTKVPASAFAKEAADK